MADRKSVQTEGYQLELEHLTQEKKLMQQLLQMCTEQYAEVRERFPEEDAMKIHKDYLKKQLGRYQQCVRIAEWRAKKLRGITFGREEYPTFCEKFPAGRIPLGYDDQSDNPIALPLRQMFSLSVVVKEPETREKVYANLLEAYAREGMQVMVFKKKKNSLFGEGSPLLQAYQKRTDMILLEAAAEDGKRLVDKLTKEMQKRADLKRKYCKEHDLDAADPTSALKAFDFIRSKTKPLMVWFEAFEELETIFTAEDKASLGALFAAGGKQEEMTDYANLQRGRGYNLYYTGCFKEGFSQCGQQRDDSLLEQFNPQQHILRFNEEPEEKCFARWEEYQYGIPGKTQCSCIMTYNGEDYCITMPCGTHEEENPDDLNIFTLDL